MEANEPSRVITGKRRTDEQGTREQGVKLRPSEATHPLRERDALPNRVASLPAQSIATILIKEQRS